ncbi:MAG TPA: FAD binding domain-containing protein [Candidatus Binatia bacterium]|jgi:carbon-monoxide dehydrogenase medium subunit|nr:FAD binding domain-containing protein [Candidatus Binatia bacterium]
MIGSLQLVQPTTVQEASGSLSDYGEKAKIYAGGAELLLLLRNGLLNAEVLVDVKKIEMLHRVTAENGVLRVGACVTHRALENSALVRDHAPSLAYAESQVANVRVRNQGTLGGNLAFNDPHSDPGTVLLIHNASVTVENEKGERCIALNDFFIDMYATALEPGELLLYVEIPALPPGMKSAYVRLHRYQRPTLGVAVSTRMNNGALEEVRLAVGCVGPKAERLTELETKITGTKLSDAQRIVAEETNYLRDLLRPVDDLLGSAEYKLYMTGVMLGDALEEAARDKNARH